MWAACAIYPQFCSQAQQCSLKQVKKLEALLAEARDSEDVKREEKLLKDLARAKEAEAVESAEYTVADNRRKKEQREAEVAREHADKEANDITEAKIAYERELAEASAAAEQALAATQAAQNAQEAVNDLSADVDEVARKMEEQQAVAAAKAEAEAAELAANEAKMALDERLRLAAVRRKTNKTGGSHETFFSRAARQNEEEAARGTDWERSITQEGRREWKDKRALLAGTWSQGPGSRLEPGLYSAAHLDPKRPTRMQQKAKEMKMEGRGARASEYMRRRRLAEAHYPTLKEPLEPGMAAWGARAPPPFHPPPEKPRIAGKLEKWRPAVVEETGNTAEAWRTRYAEVRMETADPPVFDTEAQEQVFLTAEVKEDLAALGKPSREIQEIMLSVKTGTADEDVQELLYSEEGEARRQRRRMRPVLTYRHKAGGRELGRIDLRGATLTRSYRSQDEAAEESPVPLTPADLEWEVKDQEAAAQARRRLQQLVGEGPRAQALQAAVIESIEESWDAPESAPSQTVEAEPVAGRELFFTITARDPRGGQPHVVSPEPRWEQKIKRLGREVGGSSRLDVVCAMMETEGNVRLAKQRLLSDSAGSAPRLNYVADLLKATVLTANISATFGTGTGTSTTAGEAEAYLQQWYEQIRYAIWEADCSVQPKVRYQLPTSALILTIFWTHASVNLAQSMDPWEDDPEVVQPPPPQEGPESFYPAGGPQDGPVVRTKGHPSFYQPPPASLYGIRGKLRYELELNSRRWVPSQSGLYRRKTDEFVAESAERAAMSWRAGGKAGNGGTERWKPQLDARKAALMKSFSDRTEDNGGGKSVGEVAAEGP